MRLDINFDDITVEEAEFIEEYSGLSLEDFFAEMEKYSKDNKNPPMKMLTPVIWIAGRQDNPNFTVEQAKKVKFSEIQGPEGNAQTVEQRPSNGTGAPKKARAKKVKAVSES